MSCPVCLGVCRCLNDAGKPAASEHVAVVIDPEHYGSSEEQFTANPQQAADVDVTTALEAAARSERLAQLRPARRTVILAEPRPGERTLDSGEWRREVTSRVSRYRARRRPRVERPRSLGLNFDAAPPSSSPSILPLKKTITPAPIAPAVDRELSSQPVDLMAMLVDIYGIERCWPNLAARNENPFWKRAAVEPFDASIQVTESEAVLRQAAHLAPSHKNLTPPTLDDAALTSHTGVKELVNPFIMINDFPVPEETSAVSSEQLDGSTLSDLTEALSALEQNGYADQEDKIIRFPGRSPVEPEAGSNSVEDVVKLNPFEIIEINVQPPNTELSLELLEPSPTVLAEELAEPVPEEPHVFEADEINQAELACQAEVSVQAAPPIATVELSPMPERAQAAAEVDPLLPVAPLLLRTLMEGVDFCISMTGFALFSLILMWMGALPQGKALAVLAAVLPGVFWSLYQYLFLVNTARTPGMWLTDLKLAGFDQNAVSRPRRRARALSMALSTFALGLGFIWVLLDQDRLCWHDRASRTFVTRR
ncbi:MAG TPA: RDD family protein [Terriglobales bacterium]|nr:RDD family protein [Terriglobales bacterium]